MIAIIPVLIAASSLLAADHARNDYSKAENWLCRPGLAGDVCGASKPDSTTVPADGSPPGALTALPRGSRVST